MDGANPDEHLEASIRAKVEHPFRVIKRQVGFTEIRYRKNTAQLMSLFMLRAYARLLHSSSYRLGSRHALSNGSRQARGATSWWIAFGPHEPGA